MRKLNLKTSFLLLILLALASWGTAKSIHVMDGSPIVIKESHVQGTPKGSAIHASIYGHTLTVAFSQSLGQVAVQVISAMGDNVEYVSVLTPSGMQLYIPLTGSFIVTFTLPNGDEYFGEFEILE